MPEELEQQEKVDFRLYIGMLFFRWQIIALCFLYSLLGGVLYIHLTPKEYLTRCSLLIYRDPHSIVTGEHPFASWGDHAQLFMSPKLANRVINRLVDKWGKQMGGAAQMRLPVRIRQGRAGGPTIDISVNSSNPRYAEDYLNALLEEHQAEWQSMSLESSSAAVKLLEKELALLEEKIRAAEDDLIEYERLHDVTRVQIKGADESAYLAKLISHRRALTTELMMMEHHFPQLKDANETVIAEVARMTRETAAIGDLTRGDAALTVETGEDNLGERTGVDGGSATSLELKNQSREDAERAVQLEYRRKVQGWQNLRVALAQLQLKERELLTNLKPEHPEVKEVRRQIENIENQLKVAAAVELANLRDRYNALKIELDAIETAEYKWQAKNLFAAQRQGELRRLASTVTRYENQYYSLYNRLHDTKISEELKVERFNVVTPVTSNPRPIWPDPMKVLLVAVAIGLGSGFGLALTVQLLDNKIQSIRDVEKELGIQYLGGVPYWVHSGLEKTIRPIVTEEHSSGATEAYRALRTNIIAALNKINERIFFMTSADSREGKTLTVLNVAIMIAQMNKKVLLVDMDMRRGRLHRSLGVEREPGVSNVLREGQALRDVVQKTKVENLYFVPTGSPAEDAAELLQSSNLMSMLVEIQDEYDYVAIDTSPVLRVADTVITTTQGVGVVIYVARVNHTPKPLIKYSLEMLKDARILGLVMNSIEMHKISSLYYTYQYPNYAYYSNAYAYGYNYYYYGDHKEEKQQRRVHSHRRGIGSSLRHWIRKNLLPSD